MSTPRAPAARRARPGCRDRNLAPISPLLRGGVLAHSTPHAFLHLARQRRSPPTSAPGHSPARYPNPVLNDLEETMRPRSLLIFGVLAASLVLAACSGPSSVQVPVTVVVKETQPPVVQTEIVKETQPAVVQTEIVEVPSGAFTRPNPITSE